MAERIVIAEDDEGLAFVLREALIRKDYDVEIAPTAGILIDRLGAGAYDLVLLDVKLPDMDGLDALPRCRELAPETPIIVMTAHGTRQIAMDAITRGAYDFFTKPLKMAEFQVVVARALDRRRLQQQVKALRAGQGSGFEELVGQSESLRRVTDIAQRAAPTDLTILIEGESGTGKEVLARAIHRLSARKDGPLIPVNAAAIPEGLLESELFGHERGAFTGAEREREGVFEYATGGTLFLDEIGDMPLKMQAKLLRVLETGEVVRLGSNDPRKTDVRLVSATNKEVKSLVAAGQFREDLLFRIQGSLIALPPLRERREDIPRIVRHAVTRAMSSSFPGQPIPDITDAAMMRLTAYAWPGNVRQLLNVVQNMVVVAVGEAAASDKPGHPIVLDLRHIPDEIRTADEPAGAGEAPSASGSLAGASLEHLEKRAIRETLRLTAGNREQAAKLLGIGERTLYRKLKEYGLR